MSFHIPARRAAVAVRSSQNPILPTTTTIATTAAPAPATSTPFICHQCRHATLLKRPKRPYTFTQLVTLSDGSTFTQRTTSPVSVYQSTRDTRNAPVWNPSSSRLANVEQDEAGRLAAFRSKFGRGWDAITPADEKGKENGDTANADQEEEDNLLDLISSFGTEENGKK